MTEPIDPATEIPDAVADLPEPVEIDDADDAPSPNGEAKKWRLKLRDEKAAHAESRAALEAMAARVEALQRQHVEAAVESTGLKPAALWAVTDLAGLLGEDGAVDADKLDTATAAARDLLGIPKRKPTGTVVPGVGSQPTRPPKATWEDAFAPRR